MAEDQLCLAGQRSGQSGRIKENETATDSTPGDFPETD